MTTDTPITTYHYPIGSGSMRYIIIAERDIELHGNEENGFFLLGKLAGGDSNSSVNLSEMLLEDAMTNDISGTPTESERLIDAFSRGLGHAVAGKIGEAMSADSSANLTRLAVACLVRSLGGDYTVTNSGNETTYIFAECPLESAEKRTHIHELALARHALYTLFESTISASNHDGTTHFSMARGTTSGLTIRVAY